METVQSNDIRFNNPLMLHSVNVLGLSIKASNCLKAEGILYIGQLVARSEYGLKTKIPNMGKGYAGEIKDRLHEYGGLTLSSIDRGDVFPDKLKDPTEIKAKISQHYCIDDTSDNSDSLTINVTLRASDIEKIGEAKLVQALKGLCKGAFGHAVDCLVQKRSLTLTPQEIDEEIIRANGVSDEAQARCLGEALHEKLENVQIPVSLDGKLSSMLTNVFKWGVTEQLGGLALYPLLKPAIDKLILESVEPT